jgi:hypothetical protein
MRTTLLPALLLSLLPVVAGAQAHPLVGTWEVTYPIGFEIDGPNQRARAIEATGTLTITAMDDSLVAVLVTPPKEGFPTRPPSRFTTARTDAWPVRFEQRSPATVTINGVDQERTALSRWEFTVDGDELGGTVSRGIEGMPSPTDAPRPLRGKRMSP